MELQVFILGSVRRVSGTLSHQETAKWEYTEKEVSKRAWEACARFRVGEESPQ